MTGGHNDYLRLTRCLNDTVPLSHPAFSTLRSDDLMRQSVVNAVPILTVTKAPGVFDLMMILESYDVDNDEWERRFVIGASDPAGLYQFQMPGDDRGTSIHRLRISPPDVKMPFVVFSVFSSQALTGPLFLEFPHEIKNTSPRLDRETKSMMPELSLHYRCLGNFAIHAR